MQDVLQLFLKCDIAFLKKQLLLVQVFI